MQLNQQLNFPHTAVYFEEGRYIVHNHRLNSWVVFSRGDYDLASEMIYDGKQPAELIASGSDPARVKRIVSKLLMYRVGYQGERPSEYDKIAAMQDEGVGMIVPESIYFVTTYKCNLNCIYCYADSGPERSMNGDMDTEEAKDMIRQIKDLGTRTIVFTGGEAFLRKDILTLMTYSKQIGLRVNVISNGTLITSQQKADEIAKVVDLFTISFDSLNKEQHEANRGQDTWEKAMRAIEFLHNTGITLKINQTVTKHNGDSVEPLVEFAKQRSIRLNIIPIAQLGRGDDRMQGLNFAERRRINERMQDLQLEGISHEDCRALGVKQYEHKRQCGHGTSEFSIDAKGNVFPCKLMHHPMFHAGSIREKPLREIWETSQVFERSRNRTVHSLPDCQVCTFRESCGGGCRAFHWGTTGDIDGTATIDCASVRRGIRKKMLAYFTLVEGGVEDGRQTVSTGG